MTDSLLLDVAGAPARIAAASRRPASLGATPEGAISLAMGEPYTGTDTRVVDAAVAALRAGRTRYAPLTGAPDLRDALANKLSARHGRTIRSAQVVPTHGASAGLAATILALVQPGDRVVIPEPTYSLYADHVALAGGTVVWVPNRTDGALDLDRLAAEVRGARMLILCNPGNPSGVVYSRADLEKAGRLLEGEETFLLSDEAYADIVFDGIEYFSALDQPGIQERVICCGTFSKSYAMTGWRIGHVVAAEPVAAAINLVHRTFNGALNTAVQDAAVAALALPDSTVSDLRGEYQHRRDLVVERLAGVQGVQLATPQGAFYAFPKVDMAQTSDELTERLAAAGVLVRSGREYGPSGEGHFRISFATDLESLDIGLRRIVELLEGPL